jgi:hypothetical protein
MAVMLGAQPAALASTASAPTWTEQSPATHPSARNAASMAYDATTGDVVLFGGIHKTRVLDGTWTWDGSTWTKQAPATHPSAREAASMAYDAATSNIVLFGGLVKTRVLDGTWAWSS